MRAFRIEFGAVEKTIFTLLLVLQVVIIWSLPVFITQDGPSHLYNASLLTDLSLGNEFVARVYEVNTDVFPNWFSTVVLALLQFIFSPIIAEKLFVTALVISLAFSFRCALKRIQAKSSYLSSFIFTFTYGYHLFLGFYNFLWGLAFLFLVIGLYQNNDKREHVLKPTLLLLLIYFSHPVPFVFAVLFIVAHSIRNIEWSAFSKRNFTYLIKPALVMALPCFLFIRFFLLRQASGTSVWENKWNVEQFIALRDLTGLQSFNVDEHSGLSLVFFTLLFVLLHKLYRYILEPNQGRRTGLFVLFIAAIILFFRASDEMAGGSNLEERLLIIICLTGVLFSANAKPIRGFKEVCILLLIGIFVWLVPIRFRAHRACAQVALQYLKTMDTLDREAIILPIYCSNFGKIDTQDPLSPFLRVFNHVGCYAGCKTGNIVLDNYEANTSYFPIKWKDRKNPYRHLSLGGEGGMEENPPHIDIDHYESQSQEQISYLLQLGDCERFSQNPNMMEIDKTMSVNFELVSKQLLSGVYKRK